MNLAEAIIVLGAAKKIANLAASETLVSVAKHLQTSSLLGNKIPRSDTNKDRPESDAQGKGSNNSNSSSSGSSSSYGVPIALHPGALNRQWLIGSARKADQLAAVKTDDVVHVAIETADLSYLNIHVPYPPIALRSNPLSMECLRELHGKGMERVEPVENSAFANDEVNQAPKSTNKADDTLCTSSELDPDSDVSSEQKQELHASTMPSNRA
ncbi:hypothetical protein GGI22_004726, partial [Coemansia erecta]